MGFGRNPHVAKAEAAEQKARTAKDALASKQQWRDAAHQWERAADRETDDKRRIAYSEKANAARAIADGETADPGSDDAAADSKSRLLMN